jgi:hypothetical protein
MEMNASSIIVLVLVVLAIAGILVLRRASARNPGDGRQTPPAAGRAPK